MSTIKKIFTINSFTYKGKDKKYINSLSKKSRKKGKKQDDKINRFN